MKRVLLIGFVVFCIFQMMVMAAAITIGSAAENRNTYSTVYTLVSALNAASGSGTITSIEIWANTEMANCEVATFYIVSGSNLSTRDYETVHIDGQDAGVVPAGSKQTATVSLDVVAGDYIGIYYTAGAIEVTSSTNDWDILAFDGDGIPSTDRTFEEAWNRGEMSLYGTGATAGIIWNTITISKWNTVTISKWNGI